VATSSTAPAPPPRILLVGAGSVGQVYGRHLQEGGAHVAFYVREKYAAQARGGFPMILVNRGPTVARFQPDEVLTSLEQVRAARWDQVWLCISSTALLGDWLGPLVQAAGEARLVSFQPGLRDGELVAAHLPPERVVKGLIAFSSWHSPLNAQDRLPAGMAYWFPPLSPCLFEGEGAAFIVTLLRRGGLPARVGPAQATTARGSAFLLPTVAALECAGWTFAGLREGPWSALAADAAKEAMAIAAAHLSIGKGPMGALANGCMVRLASRAAPVVAPFDIEAFLRAHFEKVGDQTELALDTWITEGQSRGLPVSRITELAAALRAHRAAAAG